MVAKCGTAAAVEERTQEADGYSSKLRIITIEPGGITRDPTGKARLLINFGEHGRELISPEIALRLVGTLCDPAARAALLKDHDMDAKEVEAVLQRVIFKITPVENPRGRALVEDGELCERKNGRGVDPNRNWSVHWGYKEPDYDPREEFPGKAPFSEPETTMLRALATDFSPHVWLNVHSGMEALFTPYDHKNEVPEGPAAEATMELLKNLNKRFCGGRCAVGPGGKTVGYFAHGTATDYMQDELGVGMVMTWEVFGDMNADFEDCFRMFNPLDAAGVAGVVEPWTAAIYATVAALPGHPAVPELAEMAKEGGSSSGSGSSDGGGGAQEKGVKDKEMGPKGAKDNDEVSGVELEGGSSAGTAARGVAAARTVALPAGKPSGVTASFGALAVAVVLVVAYLASAPTRRALLGRLKFGRRRPAGAAPVNGAV